MFAELVKCWSTTMEMLLQFRRIHVGERNEVNCNC